MRRPLAAALFVIALALPLLSLAAEGTYEENSERPGGDYATLTLEEGSPARFCRDACQSDTRCRAWTFVRSAAGSPAPRCMLKSQVPDAKPNPCCDSGFVR